jgi:hypothetical protein
LPLFAITHSAFIPKPMLMPAMQFAQCREIRARRYNHFMPVERRVPRITERARAIPYRTREICRVPNFGDAALQYFNVTAITKITVNSMKCNNYLVTRA